MRGQAFIVFETVDTATKALNGSKDKVLFGKAMNVAYAKSKSQLSKSLENQSRASKKRKTKRKKKGNHRIIVKNFPLVGLEKYATKLFMEFQGFVEVTFEDAKPGTAFVDFASRKDADKACEYLQGFELTPQNLLECHPLYGRGGDVDMEE